MNNEFNKEFYTAKEVKELLNISNPTLYQWRLNNKVEYSKVSDKKFLYTKESIHRLLGISNFKTEEKRKNVIYCRVSNQKQKNDLEKQKQLLSDYCNTNGVIPDLILSEVASGMNEERIQFNKLIDLVINNEIDKVYITYKDRLTRFGFTYFENLFKKFDTEIVILNNNINQDNFENELTEDLISMIQHFSMEISSDKRKQLKEIHSKLK